MNWAFWLSNQLPELLLLPPAVGFIASLLLRHRLPSWLPTATAIFAIAILGGLAWKLEVDRAAETIARIPANEDLSVALKAESAQELANLRVDKLYVQQIAGRFLVVSGLNFWPIFSLVVVSAIVTRRGAEANPVGYLPTIYFFEATSILALTTNDVRVFLLSFEIGTVTFGVMLGLWGGLSRRAIAERFLIAQFWAASMMMIGLASLVVSIPWMKIEDSPARPAISYELSSLVYEIQKWMTTNEYSFHYGNIALPWLLFVLSIGFAIQFGLFPFHATQVSILSRVPGELATLYLAGFLPVASVGWWRLVLPIFPELLVGYDGLILFSTIGGAIWGAIRTLSPTGARERFGFLFLSLSSVSFLGCHCFSRVGMCGAWLMQQQLTLLFCTLLLAWKSQTSTPLPLQTSLPNAGQSFSNRTLTLLTCIPCLGLFASGYILVSELFRESTWIPLTIIAVAALCCVAIWTSTAKTELVCFSLSESLVLLLLATVVNLFPSLVLHQCEHEFARVFRRFERASVAVSAEPDSDDRQSSPRSE